MRPVITAISESFLNSYNPHHHLSIDEAMIPFKGRSSLKQYIPNKPTKRGIKVWVRADALNGYVSALQVYVGKQGGATVTGLGEKVVKDLTEAISGKNYNIYCDNYFTSVILFKDLLKHNIYACGTIRCTRKGYPDDIKPYLKKGLKERGDYKLRQEGNLLLSLWQDNKPVSILSTNCQPEESIVQRRQRDGTKKNYRCPTNVLEYNKYMGGVDHSDQLRQYYSFRLKSHKFYKYIFWFVCDVAITNAYILSRYIPTTEDKGKTYLEFRVNLAKQLIGEYMGRKFPGRPSSSIAHARHVTIAHYPLKADKRSRCTYCYKKKENKWTQ